MKKIIVTGSEGLIGTEICKYFEKNNNKVYRLDLKLGHDLNDEEFVKSWFKKNPAKYLVNCFALNDAVQSDRKKGTLFDFPLETFLKYLNVNLVSLFSVCREFAKNPIASGIVNFASTYAQVSPIPDLYTEGEKHIGYSVSKGAVLQLTRHLAVHLSSRNIRVNCIVPGGVKHEQSKDFIRMYNERVPIKRMMEVSELNGLVSYLCSEESSYMNGSIINIDGGWTAW